MTAPQSPVSRALLGALVVVFAAGCDKSQPESAAPTAANATADAAATEDPNKPAKLEPCMGQLEPADDGLIDDFEDGDHQITNQAERDGTWWTAFDSEGSVVTLPEGQFTPAEGGADSTKAAHVTGKTVKGTDQAWGVEFGANFRNAKGGLYDASKYAGLSFKAKAIGPTKNVRVNIGDVNTHQDAGVCQQCWNHFRKDFTLSEEWQTYTMRFADLAQRPGWGFPRPENLNAEKVVTLSFSLEGGQEFDIWVDDVQFLTCVE